MSTAVIMGAVAAATTVAKGYGEYQNAKYSAKVQRTQADAYANAAYRKRLETAINEDRVREANRRELARNMAASIEQGNTGTTAIGALGQQATDLEQNALDKRYEGLSSAEMYQNQANQLYSNASYTKKQGRNMWRESLIKAPFAFAGGYATAGGSMAGSMGAMASVNSIWDFVGSGDTKSFESGADYWKRSGFNLWGNSSTPKSENLTLNGKKYKASTLK